MAQDLHAPGSSMSPNGRGAIVDDDDVGRSPEMEARELGRAYARARADSAVANVAVMMLHAAERLDPLIQRLTRISLRWAVLACSAWFTFYALSHASMPWEREVILATFMVLGTLIWWKGQS